MTNVDMIIDTATNHPDWEFVAWGTVRLERDGHKKPGAVEADVRTMVAWFAKHEPGILVESEEDILEAVKRLKAESL